MTSEMYLRSEVLKAYGLCECEALLGKAGSKGRGEEAHTEKDPLRHQQYNGHLCPANLYSTMLVSSSDRGIQPLYLGNE